MLLLVLTIRLPMPYTLGLAIGCAVLLTPTLAVGVGTNNLRVQYPR
jgi:hypothetical protein